MPDLSADRPLPLPEKIFTEEDVETLVRAAGARLLAMTGLAELPASRALLISHEMRAVLTALAAAGRLLPPSAEHREEWRLVAAVADDDGWAWGLPASSEADARRFFDESSGAGRLQRRKIFAGPWVEVDRSATDGTD